MPGRSTILNKPGTAEINQKVVDSTGLSLKTVRNITKAYWLDIDQMFSTCSGHGTYVERFGHFIMYTRGVHKRAQFIENQLKKKLRMMHLLQKKGDTRISQMIAIEISKLVTQIILLSYSIQLYKSDVLHVYPKKYKIIGEKDFNAVVRRLEELFQIPISSFPITVYYPIQKIFVQKLRKARLLQNPVVDQLSKKKNKVSKNTKV